MNGAMEGQYSNGIGDNSKISVVERLHASHQISSQQNYRDIFNVQFQVRGYTRMYNLVLPLLKDLK